MNVNIWASFVGNNPVAVSARNLAWELHQAGVEVGLVPIRGDDTRREDFDDYPGLFERMLGAAVTPGAPAIFHGTLSSILMVADDDLPLAGAIASLPLQLTAPSSYAIVSLAGRFRQVWTPCVEVLRAINQVYPGLAVLVPWAFPRAVYGQQEPSEKAEKMLVSFDSAPATVTDLETMAMSRMQNVIVAKRVPNRVDRAQLCSGNDFVLVTQADQYWAREMGQLVHSITSLTGLAQMAATATREPLGEMLAAELARVVGPRELHTTRNKVELGIVIPYYRRGADYLEACLWSVDRDEELATGFPVVVFGEPPTEQEKAAIAREGASVVQLDSWNLCRARNAGFRHFATSWIESTHHDDEPFTHILFLDCDTILPAGALTALVRRLERDPNTVAVFNVLNLPRTVSLAELVSPDCELLDAQLASDAVYERTGVGCCAVPVKAFADIRGFDETYTGWGSEDNDLLVRLVHLGVRVAVAHDLPPLFHQYHERSPTANEEMKRNVEKLATADPGRVVNPDGWGEYDK